MRGSARKMATIPSNASEENNRVFMATNLLIRPGITLVRSARAPHNCSGVKHYQKHSHSDASSVLGIQKKEKCTDNFPGVPLFTQGSNWGAIPIILRSKIR